MRARFHNLIAFSVSMAIIATAFIIFAIIIVTYSLPPNYEEYENNSVSREVELLRNDYGVPHIIAESERDMYFMLGYAQAQDRLWQIDHLRRLAKGETAEIFGNNKIAYDKFIRAFALKELAVKSWRAMSGESRSVLTSFSKGINFFIEQHKDRLPFEFDNLEYFPAPWEPTDCIAIYKYIGLQLSAGFRQDLLIGELADKFGMAKANTLVPQYPNTAPYIYEVSPLTHSKNADSASLIANTEVSSKNTQSPNISVLAEVQGQVEVIAGASSSIGSNAWVVSSTKKNIKKAVLANDPHLSLSNPSHWYQAKLTCPNYNLTGLLLAGTPLMLIGRNDNISWGIANAMGDDFDYYYEKIDSKNPKNYLDAESGSIRFNYSIDTIAVKAQPAYLYYKRSTNRSGVISDFHTDNNEAYKKHYTQKPVNNPNSKEFLERYCITYCWTGGKPSDDIMPIYYMQKAKNFKMFKLALERWQSPLLNFVFADVSGNIAMLTAGDIPIRANNCNPNLPNPAWVSSSNWIGNLPKNEMPFWVNPDKQFVFAANNKLNYSKPYFISNYWDSPARAERIETLIRDAISYSSRDAQIMQYDLYSTEAEKIVKQLIPVLNRNYSELKLIEKQAFERLKKWDYILLPDIPSTMIYNKLYLELMKQVFLDDLGEHYFAMYLKMQSYASIKLMEVLNNPNDPYIKNYRNPEINSIDKLLLSAYKNAISELENSFASKHVYEWKYGDVHFVELKHPFAIDKFLSYSFTMERFKLGGNGSTINNTQYNFNTPYEAVVGASCRFISDMKESYVYTSIPGGISGQTYSSNYSDQMQLWVYGGYIKLPVSRKPAENFVKSVKISPSLIQR